jgi:hypothetical protein
MVEEITASGKTAILVTNLNTSQSIQGQVKQDLEGTEYKFNTKGLVLHDKYAEWIAAAVDEALAQE